MDNNCTSLNESSVTTATTEMDSKAILSQSNVVADSTTTSQTISTVTTAKMRKPRTKRIDLAMGPASKFSHKALEARTFLMNKPKVKRTLNTSTKKRTNKSNEPVPTSMSVDSKEKSTKGKKTNTEKDGDSSNKRVSYRIMICEAIIELHERGGSSRMKIKNFIQGRYGMELHMPAFRAAFAQGVKEGIFLCEGQSFRMVPGKAKTILNNGTVTTSAKPTKRKSKSSKTNFVAKRSKTNKTNKSNKTNKVSKVKKGFKALKVAKSGKPAKKKHNKPTSKESVTA